jgi:hypothetical protein
MSCSQQFGTHAIFIYSKRYAPREMKICGLRGLEIYSDKSVLVCAVGVGTGHEHAAAADCDTL